MSVSDHAPAVFLAAEEQLRDRAYAAALSEYLRLVDGVPTFWRGRLRVADVLLNLQAPQAALAVYKALAWQAFQAGQPLAGLVAIKMAMILDPHQRDAVQAIAELYCHTSSRLDAELEVQPRPPLGPEDRAAPARDLTGAALVEAAAAAASDVTLMPAPAARLPPIPLFSGLDRDAFVAVLTTLQLRRFGRDDVVIAQGAAGDSFFVLAQGSVDVSRQAQDKTHHLAKLHAGAVFGEMALVSQAPRAATVRTREDCDVLELKRAALEHQKLQSVALALRAFTRERFLTNLTATSPVFKPFPRSIRLEIVKKFRDLPVKLGDELIREGASGGGLYLIMQGQVEVTKKDGSERALLARLREGDVFGEIALIEDTPTTATVTVAAAGDVLFLPKKEFTSTMARHPELRHELKKLTVERLAKTRDMLDSEIIELGETDDLVLL